jgi:hypothetical protein
LGVDLASNAIAAATGRGDRGGASTHKGIKHDVAYEAEHPHEPFGYFNGIWGWMILGRRSGQSIPDLLKPLLVILGGNHAQYTRSNIGSPIPTGLPLHEYKLDIVLYYRVRLIGFTQK